jgi:hypothetical protein
MSDRRRPGTFTGNQYFSYYRHPLANSININLKSPVNQEGHEGREEIQ